MVQTKARKRIWYWDILRIAAVICLVLRHISTASFEFVPMLGGKWWVFNCYGSLVAWMVPVYLMLSGASFLDPNRPLPLRTLYLRNILHMVIAFFAWSAIYVVYNLLSGQDAMRPVQEMFFEGHFHLWFLPMIIGIYMLLPAFRLITRTLQGTAYMFFLSLVVSVTLPMLQDLGWMLDGEILTGLNNVGFISAHVSFFFAGHLFHQLELSKGQRRILYALAIAATVLVFVGTWWLTVRDGMHNEDLQSDSNLLTGIQGIALFVFVKQRCKGKTFSPQVQDALKFYSSLTFGVYLIHVMFIALLDRFGFSPMTYNAMWMIPLVFCLVTPLSFLATWLIRKIPAVGKHIT